jgi:hypothetical protein
VTGFVMEKIRKIVSLVIGAPGLLSLKALTENGAHRLSQELRTTAVRDHAFIGHSILRRPRSQHRHGRGPYSLRWEPLSRFWCLLGASPGTRRR